MCCKIIPTNPPGFLKKHNRVDICTTGKSPAHPA
nr:MAG TPA: hypothetical protein [Caudoviricetes sp.]